MLRQFAVLESDFFLCQEPFPAFHYNLFPAKSAGKRIFIAIGAMAVVSKTGILTKRPQKGQKNFHLQKTQVQRVTNPCKNKAKKRLLKVWKSQNKCYFCTRIEADVLTDLLKSTLEKSLQKLCKRFV